jgi:hypothetical protein
MQFTMKGLFAFTMGAVFDIEIQRITATTA